MPTTAIRRFIRFLKESERSPETIKNYRCDLEGFADWFHETNDDDMEPQKITPTDLREFKRYLQAERNDRPSSVSRKLASHRSCLGWAAAAGILEDGRAPAMPRGGPGIRLGSRWLDRLRERFGFDIAFVGPSLKLINDRSNLAREE